MILTLTSSVRSRWLISDQIEWLQLQICNWSIPFALDGLCTVLIGFWRVNDLWITESVHLHNVCLVDGMLLAGLFLLESGGMILEGTLNKTWKGQSIVVETKSNCFSNSNSNSNVSFQTNKRRRSQLHVGLHHPNNTSFNEIEIKTSL